MNKDKKYLFLCAYGQSRSTYFAQECMLHGFMTLFAGYYKSDDNNIEMQEYHFEWADTIILLDESYKRDKVLKLVIDEWTEKYKNKVIHYYIKDEPATFKKLFPKIINKINKK